MPIRDFDGIFYVKRIPVITFEDGLFHICHQLGSNTQFQFVMQPALFKKLVLAGQEALAKWQVEQLDKVKPIPRRRRGH